MIMHNLELLQEHKEVRKAELEQDKEMGRMFSEQSDAYKEQEREQKRKAWQERKKYGTQLLNDMAVVNEDLAMNEVEWSLNKDAMKAIQTNPHFSSRLAHRLRMTAGTPTTPASRFVFITYRTDFVVTASTTDHFPIMGIYIHQLRKSS